MNLTPINQIWSAKLARMERARRNALAFDTLEMLGMCWTLAAVAARVTGLM